MTKRKRGWRPSGRERTCKRVKERQKEKVVEWEELCRKARKSMFWHVPSWNVHPCMWHESVTDWSLLMVTETVCSPRLHLVVCVHRCAAVHACLANGVFASVGGERDIPNWHRQYCIIWVTERVRGSNVTETGRETERDRERKSYVKAERDLLFKEIQ